MLPLSKHVINPLLRHAAGSTNTPFALVQHIGRHTGKHYETPIIVMPEVKNFIAALTYGQQVQWYKNITAAKYCTIVWHKKTYAITAIDIISPKEALQAFPQHLRKILQIHGTKDFIIMKTL